MKIQNLFLTLLLCIFTINAFAQIDLLRLKATIPNDDLEMINKSLPPHLKIDETGKVVQSFNKSQVPLLDSFTLSIWNTNNLSWELIFEEKSHVYDLQGFLQESNIHQFNNNTGTVDLYGHRFYSYNNNGLLKNRTELRLNSTTWDSAQISNYQYNANGYILLYEVHDYDIATSQWIQVTKQEYNYDANDNLIMYQSSYYDGVSISFQNGSRFDFTYDNTGKIKSEVMYSNWNSSNNIWGFISKDSLFYDTNGYIDYTMGYQLINNIWEITGRNLVTTNSIGNPLEIKYQLYSNQTWENTEREVYTYNANNNVNTWRYAENWDGNQWEFGREKTYVYTSFDEKEIVTSRRWENNNWRRYAKMDYDFDAYENITQWESLFFYDLDTTIRTSGQLENFFYSLHTVNTNNVHKKSVKIYPNPTTESLYVELSKPLNNGIIKIRDTQGRLVHQENYTQNLIDVSALSSGIYWLQLIGDETNQTIQFIKN